MQQDIWYYAQNNQRQGPVTLEQLRSLCSSGRVGPGDLVWTVGMEQWQAAGEAAALVDVFSGQIPAPASTAWPGSPLEARQPLPPPSAGYASELPQPLNYGGPSDVPAGFWKRVAAYLIDAVILAIPIYPMTRAVPAMMGVKLPEEPTLDELLSYFPISCATNLVAMVIYWLYFALMESSANQATLGKMVLRIKVTDVEGRRITFGRASGRYFGKMLSTLTLGIGYMMAGWTQRKQALHDLLADTLVVRK